MTFKLSSKLPLVLLFIGFFVTNTFAQIQEDTCYALQKVEIMHRGQKFDYHPTYGQTKMDVIVRLNKPEQDNIIFRSNGDFIFHGQKVATWDKRRDSSISFEGFTDWDIISYYQYTLHTVVYHAADTLVLSQEGKLFFYLPCSIAKNKEKFDERHQYDVYVQRGFIAGAYYCNGLTGELGYSYSEEYSGDTDPRLYEFTFSCAYNALQKISGIHMGFHGNFYEPTTIPLTIGLELNSLLKGKAVDFGFMPEVGLNPGFISRSLGNVGFYYGYNFLFVDHHIPGVQRNTFGVQFNLPIHRHHTFEFKHESTEYRDRY